MPNSTELSTEITTLEQVIASARNRLDGLTEEDPATRLLREQLAELIAKREALTRALEDTNYADSKTTIRAGVFLGLVQIGIIIGALINLAAQHFQTGVTLLAVGVFTLALMVLSIIWSRRDIRKYRKTHAREHPGSGESGPGSP